MRGRLVSYLAWAGLVSALVWSGLMMHPPTGASALTATPSPTPSATPTLAAPVLLEPADGAVLPQPVSPQTWTFRWSALRGACKTSIAVWQPDSSLYLGEQNIAAPREYVYYYTTASPLPRQALEPWYWKVWVTCPNGSNESETRSFSVEPAPTPPGAQIRFPILWNNAP